MLTVDLSLEAPEDGVAHLDVREKHITIYLGSVSRELHLLSIDDCPFKSIEDIIEDAIIHELIHYYGEVKYEYLVEGWRVVLCKLLNSFKECKCPIACLWRDNFLTLKKIELDI